MNVIKQIAVTMLLLITFNAKTLYAQERTKTIPNNDFGYFKAFSASQGKDEKSAYYMAITKNSNRVIAISDQKEDQNTSLMKMSLVSVGNINSGLFAIQVISDNFSYSFLVVNDNKEVHIEKLGNIDSKSFPDRAIFRMYNPLTYANIPDIDNYRSYESVKFPGHFLRHEHFKIFAHPNNKTELFYQDAIWLIQKK